MYNFLCFVASYAVLLQNLSFMQFTLFCREICFVAIYALWRGEKLGQKFCLWRKKDKYQVCISLQKTWVCGSLNSFERECCFLIKLILLSVLPGDGVCKNTTNLFPCSLGIFTKSHYFLLQNLWDPHKGPFRWACPGNGEHNF